MKTKRFKINFFLLNISLFMALLFGNAGAFAQQDAEKAAREARKYMKEAEEALAEDDFASAEAYYRQAIAKDPANAEAKYNLGNLYYNKDIAGESVKRHSQAADVTPEKPIKHNAFHNQGNAFMKQKRYKEAVEAYKNALRNNPRDEETRYNLALAKKMLEEEQKNGGGGDDQNQDNQDQNQDQQGDQGEKKQNENGEPQNEEQGGDQDQKDSKEGDDKQKEEGKPQNDQNQEQKGDKPQEQPSQQQPRPGQLSPQQVKNLLEAMGNEEKKVQDKINAERAKGAKTKTEKDW